MGLVVTVMDSSLALVRCPSGGHGEGVDAHDVAAEMLAESADSGQSARTVIADADAAVLRQVLRQSARAEQVQIRTARLGTAVVLVRVDADLWIEDAATMRAKLTPKR